jgi:hypothetical protein
MPTNVGIHISKSQVPDQNDSSQFQADEMRVEGDVDPPRRLTGFSLQSNMLAKREQMRSSDQTRMTLCDSRSGTVELVPLSFRNTRGTLVAAQISSKTPTILEHGLHVTRFECMCTLPHTESNSSTFQQLAALVCVAMDPIE